MKIHNCPRCNGNAILDTRTLITYIFCVDCGYRVMDNDKEAAIVKWNEVKPGDCDNDSCEI